MKYVWEPPKVGTEIYLTWHHPFAGRVGKVVRHGSRGDGRLAIVLIEELNTEVEVCNHLQYTESW